MRGVRSLSGLAGANASLKDAGLSGVEAGYLTMSKSSPIAMGSLGGEDGIAFNQDGTRVYRITGGSNNLNQYDVVEDPFNPTNVTNLVSENNLTGLTTAQGLVLKPDGTSFYVMDNSTDTVRQYDMSTAWDISTYTAGSTFSVTSQEQDPRGLCFSADGTTAFVGGVLTNNKVVIYSLSTAWDVSTMSFVETIDISSTVTGTLNSIGVSHDGELFYASTNVRIYRAVLSTPGDLSTAVWDSETLDSVKVLVSGNFGQFTMHPESKALILGTTLEDSAVVGIRGLTFNDETYILRDL